MTFDPTISLGTVLSTFVIIGTIAISAWKLLISLREMEWKIDLLWAKFKSDHNISEDGNK